MLRIHEDEKRRSIWAIAILYVFLHGVVATCLPDRLGPLSTFSIVVAEWAAIVASIFVSKTAVHPMRVLWRLLALAVGFHSIAMSLDIVMEVTGRPVLNYVPAFQIFFSMLYGIPLLGVVSMQTDRHIWKVTRAIHGLLSIATGAVLYFEIFSLLTVYGSKNIDDAILISRLFDGIDAFLALTSTVRWLASDEAHERGFFRVLSIFLWINAILPAIHNRLLLHHDYIWLDLLISTPYVALFALIKTMGPSPSSPSSSIVIRAVRAGSPMFLTLALVFVGMIAFRSHFYLGMVAVLFAIAGYGALNVFTQSRGIETEESLLASKEQLEKLIGIDNLTGVANRWAFDNALERELATTRRTSLPLSLLMIDVDHFKNVNDIQGHQTGDDYLKCIAKALRSALPRATDLVARYGGEEFSAILPATNHEGAWTIAERIHQAIARLQLLYQENSSATVTVSIGISTTNGGIQTTVGQIVQAADTALYMAKRNGRNRSEYLDAR